MQNLGTLRQFLNFCPPNMRGLGGGPQFFVVDWNPNILVTWGRMQNFGTLRQFFEFLFPSICHSAGGRGGPQIVMYLSSPCKVLEPYDNPFWGFE